MNSNILGRVKLAAIVTGIAGATVAGEARADVYDDTHPNWIYSTGWSPVSGGVYSGAYNGTLHLTQTPGSVASFTCNTAGFDIYISTASNRGKFQLFINGQSYGIYDAYSPTTVRQVPLFYGYFIPYGTYTFTIKTLNEKNPASTGYFVDIDAIEC
ncbi:hypothetical protein HPC49_15035 [Pyxidicoccus fallax]|uniref:Uncharacterized protein n=1 Tax=Pyxidicoccus fallax TaxID=394095 RepID=A0A848LMR1_9BACT|nr:hypothetical protein [Pyxidicoccus fallax]NMO18913.1 hypothetical protein [Pyxidicoccus fallax]NPC79545.1 hypothetical protein [Pyxidicoccus fallax]